MSSFLTSDAEYAKSGPKFKMAMPNEGDDPTYFRIVVPELVGMDYGAYPICYAKHSVNKSLLGSAGGNNKFNPTVVCLGSPHKASAKGDWPLTEEGVLKCQAYQLPGGISLHESSDTDQRFRMLVYVYNEGAKTVRGLRYWDHRVGSKSKGTYAKLIKAIGVQVGGGYGADDIVMSIADDSDSDIPNYTISALVPAPGSEPAVKFAFTDAVKEQIKLEAVEVLTEFEPWMPEEIISKILGIEGPAKSDNVPDFNTGLGGPEVVI